MEKDPNSVEQHAVGAKLDLGKPAPLLCLTDFAPALKQLAGMQVDFLELSESVDEACASAIVAELMLGHGVSTRVLLAALIVVQSHSGRIGPEPIRLYSMLRITSTFSAALLSIATLTAIGAKKSPLRLEVGSRRRRPIFRGLRSALPPLILRAGRS